MGMVRQRGWALVWVAVALVVAPAGPRGAEAPAGVGLEWLPARETRPVRGLALTIHGLNLNPARMKPIAAVLNRAGYDALNVSLSGHRGRFRPGDEAERAARAAAFAAVTYDGWLEEVRTAFGALQARDGGRGLPLVLVAYSLGGLVGSGLLLESEQVRFDRMILFAPALRLRFTSRLLRVFSFFPALVHPSFSPRAYRANDGTPMAGYNALYEGIDRWSAAVSPKLNVPTLVFIDPGDELVSADGLGELMRERGLSRWELTGVEKTGAATTPHHLIIDGEAVGAEAWGRIQRRMLDFLR